MIGAAVMTSIVYHIPVFKICICQVLLYAIWVATSTQSKLGQITAGRQELVVHSGMHMHAACFGIGSTFCGILDVNTLL